MRNLHDVASPELPNVPVEPATSTVLSLEESHRSMDNLRTHQADAYKSRLTKLGHPLRIFGEVLGIN